MRTITMGWIIRWAYDIQTYQLNGDDWLKWRPSNDMPRFDLQAKAGGNPSEAVARKMLQNLLKERVSLKAHFENRLTDSVALRPDAKGLRIVKADKEDPPVLRFSAGKAEVHGASMREFCDDLAMNFKAPVVDQTGFSGLFNGSFRVEFQYREDRMNAIMDGLKSDMGIVVVKVKLPIQVLVVDHIDTKPVEN
jgi:uncharacterized protein (TIGR03435 family)